MPAKRPLSPPTTSPLKTATPSEARQIPSYLSLLPATTNEKFVELAHYENSLASQPSAFLTHATVTARDRYPNIRPWAHNIVALQAYKFPANYINASPVTLGRGERFIATQGPRDGEGVDLFWKMAWQEKVDQIIMLTRFFEGGREKCGAYFPLDQGQIIIVDQDDKNASDFWGKVVCESVRHEDWGEVRQLQIHRKIEEENEAKSVEKTTIWHFLFTRWPDYDVPRSAADRDALTKLMRKSRALMTRPPEPRIVHCSAGVGRTGTFIALDHLSAEFDDGNFAHDDDNDDDDPVFNTVKKLRAQRMGLVHTPAQYAFIYQALRERCANNLRPAADGQDSPTKKRRMQRLGSDWKEEEEDTFALSLGDAANHEDGDS